MDKKKLIGTIIGVTMFAVLVAGATFAWLTFDATVTEGTYNSASMNFLVDYTVETDPNIGNVPMLTTGTPAEAAKKYIKVKRHAGSPDGTLQLKITTTSAYTAGEIANSSVEALNYAICNGECSGSFASAIATGVVTKTDAAGEQVVATLSTIPTTETTYYYYFWLDASKITNEQINKSYSGYIHASATQKES